MNDGRLDPDRPTADECESDAAAASFDRRALGDVVAELRTVRAALVALLRGVNAIAWARRAPAEWTLRSARAIAHGMAGHGLHHVADIRRQPGL